MRINSTFTAVTCLLLIIVGLYFWVRIPGDNLLSFRTSQDPVKASKFEKDPSRAAAINLQELEQLKLSGSAIPDLDSLDRYRKRLNKPLIVVSLLPKEELYLTNAPLMSYGLNFTDFSVITEMPKLSAKDRLKFYVRRFLAGIPLHHSEVWMNMAQTEGERLRVLGIGYQRLIYGTNHSPSEAHGDWVKDLRWVDDFVTFMDHLPQETAVHFHCEHGRGRTTVCMAMFDIYHNARTVSLKDIIDRHWALGGEDLFDTSERKGGTWKGEMLQKRKALVSHFYAYMRDSAHGYGSQSFTAWHKRQQ